MRSLVNLCAVLILTLAGGMAGSSQLTINSDQNIFPSLPIPDNTVPDWLPGVWSAVTYEFDTEKSVLTVRDVGDQYTIGVSDDGTLEVGRRRELLPLVEVVFFDSSGCVLSEHAAGEFREFSLDLNSMEASSGLPAVTGILRSWTQEAPDPTFVRILWRKLPDDFFDGAL